MMKNSGKLYAVLGFSALGGFFKIFGGVVYGSRALFVDALTSIANFIAAYATIYYYKVSRKPPDIDHHYGHYKLGFGGTLVSLISYSFVAGLVVAELYKIEPYSVSINATLFAILGFIFYYLAIAVAKRSGEFFKPYSAFTVSELIESTIVILASLAGALYTYIIDYIGALILASYIFIEIYGTGKALLKNISDIAPSRSYINDVKRTVEKHGFKVIKIKIRKVHYNLWHGDIFIESLNENITIKELKNKIRELKRELLRKHQLDATVEIAK
ncbi:MAG: cation transporter [Thermoprotei archaeon]|nr:cation transporter [Thermoprotei archaeon]